jgi:hypothetical protein
LEKKMLVLAMEFSRIGGAASAGREIDYRTPPAS